MIREVLFEGTARYERLRAAGATPTLSVPEGNVGGPFGNRTTAGADLAPYSTPGEMAAALRERLAAGEGPQLAYGYLPQVDAAAHAAGTESDRYRAQLEATTEAVRRALVEPLDPAVASETLLVLTADHGHVDTGENVDLREGFDAVWEHLRRDDEGELVRIPRRLLSYIGFEKELGLHNAEMSTSPQPLNEYGLAAQETEIRARLAAARQATGTEGIRLISDGMWTIPAAAESATEYLTDSVQDDGVWIAANMSDSARYHAFANTRPGEYTTSNVVDAPHVHLETETAIPESLITSIQPHYQVPVATDLPEYFGYALRVAAPLLALGVNSPFFPPDLYDDDVAPETVLADARMEHRIGVFESVLNPETDHGDKVRFPADVATVEEAVERIVEDHTVVPVEMSDEGRFDDRFKHLRHKHGSFWRWVRPVFEGSTEESANARIEFRPIPAQPTVRDGVAFQATFAGLMEALPAVEHPIGGLEWERARENFYAAAADGLRADVEWITADGDPTTDPGDLYPELFEYAIEGLVHAGVDPSDAEDYVRPLRDRARARLTPARWKHRQARRAVDDGADLAGAIHHAQRAYVERQEHSIIEGDFGMWIAGER